MKRSQGEDGRWKRLANQLRCKLAELIEPRWAIEIDARGKVVRMRLGCST